MANHALIGQFGPEFTVPVERGHVRQFAKAAYANVPVHIDDERAIIPATWLVSAGVLWGYTLERPRDTLLESIDHDLSVPLHAEESYKFVGDMPRVGDQLRARTCLESIKTRRGSRGGELTFLVMLTEFRNTKGTLVAEARATTVTTEKSPDNDDWGSAVPEYHPNYDDIESRDPFASIARQQWCDLSIGQSPGAISTGPLTLFEMVSFQASGGEMNPLHYDEAHARSMGFPGMFGLGMQPASALASYAGRWLGEENVREFRARFPNVFWVGDPLTYSGKIVNLRNEEGRKIADVELECRRDTDDATVAHVWMSYEWDRTLS
ncbi:MAG: MaoC family dehydratase N-terminal domain-containing protein [Pseudomonadota bacterium]